MSSKFIIKCRYQYWSDNGKDFTDWFVQDSNKYDEQSGNEKIKQMKKDFKFIDDKTHLKHEYKLTPYDEYLSELSDIEKHIQKAHERDEKYFASDEWKELKHKKYVARKERKQHQEEYNKMMEELKNENI